MEPCLAQALREDGELTSKGEAARLINSLLHLLFDHYPTIRLIDVTLHGLVEHNLTETGFNFLQYVLWKILREHVRS